MKEKTADIDILEELIRDYKDEKEFVGEDIIKAIETLIAENKELKERNKTMLSDEEKKAIKNIKKEFEKNHILPDIANEDLGTLLNLIEKQSKEIEELKASHITTKNKSTNTEKAKIFDVIENSIDTYIEKSKPYWERIMTKDEMTIDEALTIIDDMYQDRYKIMSQKTEKETIVDLGKMDYIKFTNLEWASVRVLREVQSLNNKLEKWEDKIKAKIEELKEKNKQLIDTGIELATTIDALNTDITELKLAGQKPCVEVFLDSNYICKDKIKR